MAIGTVCLTFDFDAISVWIARGMTTPAPVARGEFGAYATPRILQLLRRKNISATWFIPGHTAESFPDVCREIVAAGHEIGVHGYAHELVSTLTTETERSIMQRSFDIIGDLLGHAPAGNRTPSWDFSPATLDILLKLGLLYDSSLMGTDYAPYYCRQGDSVPTDGPVQFGPPTSVIEMPVSWSLDDFPHFEFLRTNVVVPGLKNAQSVFENFLADVRYMVSHFDDGVVTITFHPQIVGRGHRMEALEGFIDEVENLDVAFQPLAVVASQFRNGRAFGTLKP